MDDQQETKLYETIVGSSETTLDTFLIKMMI
jgi:hypothetical protein